MNEIQMTKNKAKTDKKIVTIPQPKNLSNMFKY